MKLIEKLLMLLPPRVLDKFVSWAKRRATRKLGGVPVVWVLYRPWEPPPNVYYHVNPECKKDLWLAERMREMADYIRENYFNDEEGER